MRVWPGTYESIEIEKFVGDDPITPISIKMPRATRDAKDVKKIPNVPLNSSSFIYRDLRTTYNATSINE